MESKPCFHLRIKVMADYETSGLWCEDCGMLHHTDLDLPEHLSQRVNNWITSYDHFIEEWVENYDSSSKLPDFSGTPMSEPEQVRVFNLEGFAIATEIKDLLRDSGRAVYYWIE